MGTQQRPPDINGHQYAAALMKEIGSKDGYDPIPSTQHNWQMDVSEPPLNRLWAWMTWNCLHWGHRSPFAVRYDKKGHAIELHLEHAAKDLGMDLANVYAYWKDGAEKGLWRNGTKKEGPRRLYIRGDVPAPKLTADDGRTEDEGNCMYRQFPPYLRSKIKDLAEPVRAAFFERWNVEKRFLELGQAEVVAAWRAICETRQDTLFRDFGLEKRREEHKRKGEPEEVTQARATRVSGLQSQLQLYVQTIGDLVQTNGNGSNKLAGEYERTTQPYTPLENPLEKSLEAACERPSGKRRQDHSEGEKPSHNQHHAGQQASSVTPENRKAAELVFRELTHFQKTYRHTDFGSETVSRDNQADRLMVDRMVRTVGPARVMNALEYVATKLKGLDRNALGKRVPRAPGSASGPRSLGLILLWFEDFARREADHADERKAAAATAAEADARFQQDMLDTARRIVADPTGWSEEDIQRAREILGEA